MNANEIVGCSEVYPTMSVSDLQETIDCYQKQLGFEIQFTWGEPPVHAGVTFGKSTIHFNQGCKTTKPDGDFWLYFVVDDVDAYFEFLKGTGAKLIDEPTNREWGMREINVHDINGTTLRFGQAALNFGERITIERVEFSARIEKRLANLVKDLADHKGMTIGQVLEETILHSFEPIEGSDGEGVASPHTQRTLSHIRELKKKHAIDYDAHAGYRFTED